MQKDPIFEQSHIFAVPVIASFDDSGHIIPLYVRIDGIKVKIDECRVINQDMSFVYYECATITNNVKKNFKLSYKITSMAWFVPSEYKTSY